MQYLLLIYEDETVIANQDDATRAAMFEAYGTYTKALREAGVMVGGEALTPVSTATTVRVRHGKTTMTDGPFAETKEQLGGFYLIDVGTLDEAVAWGAKIPASATGSIEVRPILKYEV